MGRVNYSLKDTRGQKKKTFNPVHVSLPMEKMIMMHSDPDGLKLGKDLVQKHLVQKLGKGLHVLQKWV